MLERTGNSLKSCTCTLQRVLPKPAAAAAAATATTTASATATATAAKRSRRLHTGFWQHGALALEIAGLWHLPSGRASDIDSFADLRSGPEPSEPASSFSPPSSSPSCSLSSSISSLSSSSSSSSPWPSPSTTTTTTTTSTGLSASAFLLDFLYPSATRKLLQRLYPVFLRSQDGNPATAVASRRRHMTSSSVAEETRSQNHAGFHDALESSHARSLRRQQSLFSGRQVKQHSKTPASKSLSGVVAPRIALQQFTPEADSEETQVDESRAAADVLGEKVPAALRLTDLLARQHQKNHNAAWDAYCRLEGWQQHDFRRDMVLYLSKSHGIVDIGRAISLFRQVSSEDWDNDLLAAGVSVLVRSGDLKRAIETSNAGLESRGLAGGLGPILLHAVAHRKWPVLIRAWLHYYTLHGSQERDGQAGDGVPLDPLEKLPGLELSYFSFEHYLLADAAQSLRAINRDEKSRLGLAALRRKLAQMAITQSSQADRAAAILEMCGDQSLYHDYLLEAVSRWQQPVLKSSATWLADIYKKYGNMPGARPSIPLLRGMFDLFYPNNVAGLEQVYKDWHRTWGGLDRWGYEKFLKLYAAAGDVPAVRGLWKRYVASYPKLLTRPRAFRSTMNVYAQVGDAAGAERELRLMKDKYGVRPDLDMWNILLKCYARRDDYQRAVLCFEEICKMYRPDSYTYAHVMTMAAKKGDLEATLAFFHRAQRDKVALSKEIAMSLVTVCCQNDRLLDAERILTELAARGVTSTGIWNQLINFNGKQGRLKKCYELLQLMKSFNVAWDHQTHEFLLRALVRVNQVHPAYRLLRSAMQDKVFPVGPEHFAIVMAGAARTGDFSLVEMIAAQLARAYESTDFNAHAALMDAAFHKAPTAHRTRGLGKEMIKMLRTMRDRRHRRQEGDNISMAPVAEDLTSLRKQTKDIGRAIRLLVELRDFSSAEELVNLYAGVMGQHGKGEPLLPPEIVSALMLGYLKDRKYRQIHAMWSRTLDGVLARSRRQPGAPVLPAHQYDLARPLLVVARAFREQNNGEGLLECVRRVTGAGFRLTRSNWNVVVQYLAETGQWEPAMEWCEKMLMPRWRGWRPARRSALHERRLLQNTRVLQASRAAVLSLQRQWLKLRKLAAWSPAVSAKLAQVERLYPRLHHAFVTTDYENLARAWEGGRGGGAGAGAGATGFAGLTSLRGAAAELLRPFSHKELRAMEKSLVRRQKADSAARLERTTKTAGAKTAPTTRAKTAPTTRARAHAHAHAPAQARARAKKAREAKRKRDKAAASPHEITVAIP